MKRAHRSTQFGLRLAGVAVAASLLCLLQTNPMAALADEGDAPAQEAVEVAANEAPADTDAIDETAAAEDDAQSTTADTEETTGDETATSESADPAATEADPAEETTIAPAPEGLVADGLYAVESGVAYNQVIDMRGGANTDLTVYQFAQIYNSTKANAQKLQLVYDPATGYYKIVNPTTKKLLDVYLGKAEKGAKVGFWKDNGSIAQRWILVGDEAKGYELVSAANDKLCIDVEGGKSASGTSLRLWTRNGSVAQRFWFISLEQAAPASEQVLEDGAYTIKSGSFMLDVAGGSTANGANVRLYSNNGSMGQKWYLTYRDGFYTVQSMASGLALDVKGASVVPGANVQLYNSNHSDAQLWRIEESDGGYRLVNKVNGLVLDVEGGKAAKGTNVDVFRAGANATETWAISKTELIETGCVTIGSALSDSLVFDVKGGSTVSGARIQLYSSNGTQAQKWMVSDAGNDQYEIRSIATGLWLGENSSSQLVQLNTKFLWTPVWTDQGVSLRSGTSSIDVPGGKAAKGTLMQTHKYNNSKAQAVRLKSAWLLNTGNYLIQSPLGTVAEVKGDFYTKGQTIQMAKASGTMAQAFTVTLNSNGTYTITNTLSKMAFDVASASKDKGADVRQWTSNGSNAQRWKLSWKDGTFTITNVNSGLVLDIAGGSSAAGANVRQWTSNGSKAQTWTFKPTTVTLLSKDTALNNYVLNLIKSKGWKGESGLKAAYNYVAGFAYDLNATIYMYGNWETWSVAQAKATYASRSGNCNGQAALFTWIARGLGYDAKAVVGRVLTGHGWSPHGWTEIKINGTTYVVDVQQHQNDMSHGYNHNFFLVTYDNAPVYYHVGYNM